MKSRLGPRSLPVIPRAGQGAVTSTSRHRDPASEVQAALKSCPVAASGRGPIGCGPASATPVLAQRPSLRFNNVTCRMPPSYDGVRVRVRLAGGGCRGQRPTLTGKDAGLRPATGRCDGARVQLLRSLAVPACNVHANLVHYISLFLFLFCCRNSAYIRFLFMLTLSSNQVYWSE